MTGAQRGLGNGRMDGFLTFHSLRFLSSAPVHLLPFQLVLPSFSPRVLSLGSGSGAHSDGSMIQAQGMSVMVRRLEVVLVGTE